MARKCRLQSCRRELPAKKHCTDAIKAGGFCGISCLSEHGREKAQEARERKIKKEVREYREKSKTLSQHVSDAQTWVNRVVVAEDKHKGCISCAYGEVTDAGHYFHRGSKYRTSPLTLDRRNLTGQCRSCNSYKGGGNQHEYRLGYIFRYGQEAFDDLCEYKRQVDRGEVASLTVDECKEQIRQAKARLKELKAK